MSEVHSRCTDQQVKIFVASTAAEWIPTRVLEFSIRETSELPVQLDRIATFERSIPIPLELRNRPRTQFSFQRFLIPELCGYQGKAIYLDADMQLFTDIAALWKLPMCEQDLLTVNESSAGSSQFTVMLLDSEHLQWRIESIVQGLDANPTPTNNSCTKCAWHSTLGVRSFLAGSMPTSCDQDRFCH